ncbi:MAG: leucyl aminopeptidase family protein [Steroidobacteraceae bacterium]|nr:leucyl aminopeptidase family protein [Steroidobacteraceae bacterium]
MTSADDQTGSVPVHLVYEEDLERWISAQSARAQRWIEAHAFKAERNKLLVLPGPEGAPEAAALGMGRREGNGSLDCWCAAGLPGRLPGGRYHLAAGPSQHDALTFAFGWAYGQYKFERYRRGAAQRAAELLTPPGVDPAEVERLRAATALARDLINTPANDMTPEALTQAALDVARAAGAAQRVVLGEELLKEGFPAIHAVGRAAAIAPRLVDLRWGEEGRPTVTLVGKGVCFDSGGLDVKPAASMLLMKKDMGGAAIALGAARLIMDAQLPVRLRVILPIVENAIGANAFRPGDVLATRKGLRVEVGNTDAEGRLILCDALALADEEAPELLIDAATLTGAARVALGPELPALFSTDDAAADELLSIGFERSDPMWRLPLWAGYEEELSSKVADLNNVSSSGFAGAVFGALFLRRFVAQARVWMHLDVYGWNGKERPGRPVGAEPQCVRALYEFVRRRCAR